MENLKKTPLFNTYEKYGGKIVDFAGWALPIQFEGILQEHEAVRNHAGLFDVSHMGEIEITGSGSFDFIQNLVTNDISLIESNQMMYTLMCYPNGGIVDDIMVYKLSNNRFLCIVNASNIEKDHNWMLGHKGAYDIEIKNISNETAQLALQGPKAQDILQEITDINLNEIKFFDCREDIVILGVNCLISRSGYTGEDGFEIYIKNEDVAFLWDGILKKGKKYGVRATGLGCRDTLRFEANLPLYGNEISEDITPIEADLGFFVKLNKKEFIGKEALLKEKKEGSKRKLVGFEIKGKAVPRHGYGVFKKEENIGFVTTGYFSPTLKKSIGLALIDSKYCNIGEEVEISVRNKPIKAEIINKNFYRKNYKK